MVSPISTPPRARIEVSNDATTLESEESSSDQHPRRESTQAIASAQHHCQVSQSHLPSIPVYVYHESPSTSQRLSQIVASNSDDVEDGGDGNRTPSDSISGDIDVHQTADGCDPKFDDTGTGTGDSGVARDIMQHTPSKEFLNRKYGMYNNVDQDYNNYTIMQKNCQYSYCELFYNNIITEIDPDYKEDPDSSSEDANDDMKEAQYAGYMRLLIREPKPNDSNDSGHYAKPVKKGVFSFTIYMTLQWLHCTIALLILRFQER